MRLNKIKFIFFLIIGATVLVTPFSVFCETAKNSDSYPKLANYFLKSPITKEEARDLARFDLLILGMQVQDTNPEIFKIIRDLNPHIKILAYLSASDFPIERYQGLESDSGPWHKLKSGLSDQWWLKDSRGAPISFWPGNWAFNMSDYARDAKGTTLNEYLPVFLKNSVIASNNWDGIFFDNLFEGVDGLNNGDVDLNNDGFKDDWAVLKKAWFQGMSKMLQNLRNLLGDRYLIIGNGGTNYFPYANGRNFESFPSFWDGGWTGSMKQYFEISEKARYPQIVVFNSDTGNTGRFDNRQAVRFGLASVLMGDGYFTFNHGTLDPSTYEWYDEYDADLGLPMGSAYNLDLKNDKSFQEGVWRRDFAKGIVLVNSSPQARKINLETKFQKIKGTTETFFNNGQVVENVTLPARDGLILLRLKHPYKFFNDHGELVATGNELKSYVKMNNREIRTDLNNDGQAEKIITSNGWLIIYNNQGKIIKKVKVYGDFQGPINLAVGDINGDGCQEIITGASKGGGPHVRIYGADGRLISAGFFAKDKNERNGVEISLLDINNDGRAEIMTY